jgi:plasmid segregation protein ParM
MSTGLVAQAPQCGSHAGGMSTYLQTIADQLRPGLRDDTLFLERLDNAIRDWVKGGEGIFRFRGKEFFVKDYADLIKSKLSETISAMSRSIGSKDLVDYVTLTGGGAFLYEKAIKEMFEGYEIFVDRDARFSNVKGFYALGEQALQQLRG